MKRTNSNFSVNNALEKEEQGKLITSAGIMMENDVIGTATNYDNPYRMAANQSWMLSSLISMDKSVEEMVEEIDPEKLFAIHTQEPEWFRRFALDTPDVEYGKKYLV